MRMLQRGLCLLLLLPLFCVAGFAQQMNDTAIEQSGIYESVALLDEQTQSFLKEIGFTQISAESIYNMSFSRFLQSLFSAFRLALRENLKSLLSVFGVVFLACFADAMGSGKAGKKEEIFGILAAVLLCLSTIPTLSSLMAQASSVIESAGVFSLSAIPVLCMVTAAQGKTVSAAVCSGSAVGVSQLLNTLFSTFFMPLNHILAGVGIAAALESSFRLEKVIALVRKYLLILLSAAAVVYCTVLSVRTQIGGAVDQTTLKTVKFASSHFVPVIGNAISDAAVAVSSSLSLTKSTIGIFGMLSVGGLFVPLLIKILLWMAGLELAAVIGAAFELEAIQKMLHNLAAVLSVLIIIVLFALLLFFINFGVLLQLKSS
ncbi:MAG: hypothetical protein IJJ41_00080 [Clostridia bacterium]|nr:hypothetical protein [Clostridia bacterium]